jgi:uncharacterized protein YdeI (YjbR/CyaY-like superfamily)
MPKQDWSRLTREHHPMPTDVRAELNARGLMEKYRVRPPYQQNDYIGWILRSKRPETRAKRVSQMMRELQRGGVYMNMKWNPK